MRADPVRRAHALNTVEAAQRRLERAVGWLQSWARADQAWQDADDTADRAAAAEREAASEARRKAAAMGAESWAPATVQSNRERVHEAWISLPKDKRQRDAAGIIAKRLDLTPPTVRSHLRALGLRKPKTNGG